MKTLHLVFFAQKALLYFFSEISSVVSLRNICWVLDIFSSTFSTKVGKDHGTTQICKDANLQAPSLFHSKMANGKFSNPVLRNSIVQISTQTKFVAEHEIDHRYISPTSNVFYFLQKDHNKSVPTMIQYTYKA
jgi:hypothetical protein